MSYSLTLHTMSCRKKLCQYLTLKRVLSTFTPAVMLKAVGQALFSSGLQNPKFTAEDKEVSVSTHYLVWPGTKPLPINILFFFFLSHCHVARVMRCVSYTVYLLCVCAKLIIAEMCLWQLRQYFFKQKCQTFKDSSLSIVGICHLFFMSVLIS